LPPRLKGSVLTWWLAFSQVGFANSFVSACLAHLVTSITGAKL